MVVVQFEWNINAFFSILIACVGGTMMKRRKISFLVIVQLLMIVGMVAFSVMQ